MPRDTLQNIQEEVRIDLQDTEETSPTWDPEQLENFIEKANEEVSEIFPNPKDAYFTTKEHFKLINVSGIAHDMIRADKVEYKVGFTDPHFRNAVWDGVNEVEFFIDFTPIRNAITAIADAGGGDVTVTVESAHAMAVGDYVTLTGSTGYDGTYAITAVPSTTTFSFTATFAATGTGYIGERIRLYYDAYHVLGDSASSNTMSRKAVRIIKLGAVAYANLGWCQEFRKYTDQAAAELGVGGDITTALASMQTRIEAALTRLNVGDDYLNEITNARNTVQDYNSYAHTELSMGQMYYNQIRALTIDLEGNIKVSHLKQKWETHAWRLMSMYEKEKEKLGRSETGKGQKIQRLSPRDY